MKPKLDKDAKRARKVSIRVKSVLKASAVMMAEKEERNHEEEAYDQNA